MEAVLEVYRRAADRSHPVVCMDETSVQCTKEVRVPIPAKPGQSERYDVEYERNGVAHLLAFYAPFENWRRVDVADNHAAEQWAEGVGKFLEMVEPLDLPIEVIDYEDGSHGFDSLPTTPRTREILGRMLAFIEENVTD